jgi:ABC-type nitrate/sulfonate/bicarbonate transport system substrate-binding protein
VIRLIYRSLSIHELLLHEVCGQAGLYRDAGLEVVLEDGAGPRWKEAAADERATTVAVGGVVADWLRGDDAWRIDLIATVHPMIWVVGTEAMPTVHDLVGRCIATPPRSDMPSVFLRVVLERHGYALGTDVELVEVGHRPDRQRLLEAGEVDAALLGPEGLALPGAPGALYLGDHLEYPTVGLASRPGVAPEEAAALAGAQIEALRILRTDADAACAAMRAIDPQVSVAVARRVVRDVVEPCWTGPDWARRGGTGDVAAIAAALGVEMPAPAVVTGFLHGWV